MATKKSSPKPEASAAEELPYDLSKGRIFAAMDAVMMQVEAIGKNQQNKQQGFKYRGIDAAYKAIHPLLANHHIITVPRVTGLITRMTVPNKSGTGTTNYTMLSVEYDFICTLDGSKIIVGPIYGEGMDAGDKSTAKCLASCHKYAIFQTWCIPTDDMVDGDAESHDVVVPAGTLMPQQPLPASQAGFRHKSTGQTMVLPQVPVNTPAAPSPPTTSRKLPPSSVHPPFEDSDSNSIIIEDEATAIMSADMLINLSKMHNKTITSLTEFWHLNQGTLRVLNQNFPSQYERVVDVFAAYKVQLQGE